MNWSSRSTNVLFILFGAVILCFIGFVNLYPLVYPDTGTYLVSGFKGMVPNDRTIFYGLFARHISLSSSPWYIIFVQGLFLSYLLYRTFSLFFSGNKRNFLFIASITILTLTTGLSYTVSILIPDVFPAITLLCLIQLLFNDNLGKKEMLFVSLLFVFSITTHLSNIPILLGLLIILGVYFFKKGKQQETPIIRGKRLALCAILFAGSLVLIPSVNYMYDGKFRISDGSHVFMMNHLRETGILDDYLEQVCATKDYKICDYKDKLGGDFMWDYVNSPLYITGGWAANKDEYNRIITDILLTPKYLIMFSQKMVEYSLKQMFTFNITVAGPQLEGSAPAGQIAWRFKDTLREYQSSLQNLNRLEFGFHNSIQQFLILFSMVFLVVILLTGSVFNKLDSRIRWILIIVIIHSILTSIVCSNLSTVVPRYQNRIIWILPLLSFIIIALRLEKSEMVRKLFELKD